MKKLKIYLDTSVISHLEAPDVPEKMADTNRMWDALTAGTYEIFVSNVTTAEIERCHEPKRTKMLERMQQIKTRLIPDSDEIDELASNYIENGVLPKKSFNDCLHIAAAVVWDCDVIVSWNFKHLVNFKTINKVKIVNAINHYKEIQIISPSMIAGGDYGDECGDE